MSKFKSLTISEDTANKLNLIKLKLGIPNLSYAKAIQHAVDSELNTRNITYGKDQTGPVRTKD